MAFGPKCKKLSPILPNLINCIVQFDGYVNIFLQLKIGIMPFANKCMTLNAHWAENNTAFLFSNTSPLSIVF